MYKTTASEIRTAPIRSLAKVGIPVTLCRDNRPILMEILKLLRKPNEVTLRDMRQDGANCNCIIQRRGNLVADSEHDATLHGSGEWIVSSFCAGDSDAAGQFVHVGGVALGLVFETCRETT